MVARPIGRARSFLQGHWMSAAYPSSVIVALDVGNTKIALGIVRSGDVTSARRAPTRGNRTVAGLEATLTALLTEDGAALDTVEVILLSSVVPSVTAALADLARARAIRLIVADGTNIPIAVRVDDPAAVGHDRLVNAFAAGALYGR